jgi:hypothetical protein
MQRSQRRVAQAHTLGLMGLTVNLVLILVAVAFIGAEASGALTLNYFPALPAVAGAALLVGVPSGALFGWSNEQRRTRRS